MSISSAALLNPVLETHETKRKRKRDELQEIELDTRPFSIRPESSDPFAKPRTFTPVSLLSRANLPLAHLDTSRSGSRLFSAYIDALEACHDHGLAACVLIAEEQVEHRLYAIERADRRTYALCKLGSWVKRQDFEAQPTIPLRPNESETKRRALQFVEGGSPWWSRATVDLPSTVTASDAHVRPKLSMLDVLPTAGAELEGGNAAKNVARQGLSPREVDNGLPDQSSATGLPFTADEQFQELAKQYLEALYLSRTSLAYFTKGPLSRIRAAFTNPASSTLQIAELIVFLREAIMSSAATDKKYREEIAGIIKKLPAAALANHERTVKTKKKRKWKPKRDKHGFFADEKDYVEQWWIAQDDSGSAKALDAGLQQRMPGLRNRETYLQIILTLEVLALEAAYPPSAPKPETQAPSDESQDQDSQIASLNGRKPKTSKKAQDLPALLESLLDKLCIWHSLEAHSPAKKPGTDVEGLEDNDELKSFCIEVIIPFYMSRIPRNASMVNRKLGGPSAPSPAKCKPGSRKPGEPAVRQQPEKKPRKPLARVSTDTLNHASRSVPSLHRSATDGDALPLIKRESSEAPMDSIPPTRQPVPAPRKRTSLMHSISFSKREVDLSAMSQTNMAKLRKKAEVEEKLKNAITTLKKPNRALAVKEVAESADLSFAKATAKGRAVHGSRAKPTSGVHVAATPKHNRSVKATPGGRTQGNGTQNSRPSSTSFVPSSSVRVAAHAPVAPSSTFTVPQTGHRARYGVDANFEDTPSRGFAKFMPPGIAHQPGTLHSPTAVRRASLSIEQTPSKHFEPLSLTRDTSTLQSPTAARHASSIEQTPSKRVRHNSIALLGSASPELVRSEHAPASNYRMDNGAAETIYDALGWDDEYDDLA